VAEAWLADPPLRGESGLPPALIDLTYLRVSQLCSSPASR